MENILRKLTENNFSNLAGLVIDASIPLSESLINEFIEDALRRNKNISDCRISIFSQNRISVDLKAAIWPWPINLKVQIESPVDFSGSPKLRARLENHGILGKLGTALKAFPEGIQMEGDQVVIDVESFLVTTQQRKLLELVKSLGINTESGKIIVDMQIEVTE